MKAPNIIPLVLLVILAAVLIVAAVVKNNKTIESVKNGEYQLACKLTLEGYTLVDSELIVDNINDVWIFTNGYSKTCKVLK